MRWFESCCALRARSQRLWMGRERLRWQQSEMAIAWLPLDGIMYERVTSDIDGHHHHDPTHSAGRVPAISRCFLALLHRQVSVLSAVFAFVFALWALTSAGGEPTTRERRHANGDSDVNERERDFADGPPVSLAVAGDFFGGLLTSTAALLAAVVVK